MACNGKTMCINDNDINGVLILIILIVKTSNDNKWRNDM